MTVVQHYHRRGAICFGTVEQERAYAAECKAALRRQSLLGIRFAVAPRLSVVAPSSGRVIAAGGEVTEADLVGSTVVERDYFTGELHRRPIPAWRALKQLVDRDVVLEADLQTEGPQAA